MNQESISMNKAGGRRGEKEGEEEREEEEEEEEGEEEGKEEEEEEEEVEETKLKGSYLVTWRPCQSLFEPLHYQSPRGREQ